VGSLLVEGRGVGMRSCWEGAEGGSLLLVAVGSAVIGVTTRLVVRSESQPMPPVLADVSRLGDRRDRPATELCTALLNLI
jgi:hypothetical protein